MDYFPHRCDQLFAEDVAVADIAEQYGTPCYIYSRAALESAPDGRVMVPGSVCGVEDGDYNDLGDHFEWAGADSGSCDVSFTFLGDGNGNYVRDRDLDSALTFFRFVGAGLGNYTDSLSLAPPRTRTLADMTMRLKGGAFSFVADGAGQEQPISRGGPDFDLSPVSV